MHSYPKICNYENAMDIMPASQSDRIMDACDNPQTRYVCIDLSILDQQLLAFEESISHLSKLKFRREESISLFFKEAPDDPIIYMCHSSADAVNQIQAILKQHAVKGNPTNTTMTKAVQLAVEFLNDVKEKEIALVEDPRLQKLWTYIETSC